MPLVRDLAGDTLSHRYRLMSPLAGGGMGTVYRAHDLLLDRAVAVKVLSPALAADPALVARFKQEARAAARLSHPHVVAVHDWGWEAPDTYYIVMELVSGSDLRDVLFRRGRLSEHEAAEIVAAVCDALHAAHDIGLVHRDVKPENVLIDRAGRVRVADFGIAAAVDAQGTMPGGTIPGTLRYLAPEQAAGSDSAPTTDVWAAGALLYELVTGVAPDQGGGLELLRRRAVEPLRAPSDVMADVSSAIDAVCLRACAVDPAARYATAADLARELRALSTTGATPNVLVGLAGDATGEVRDADMEVTSRVALRRNRRRPPAARRVAAGLAALLVMAGGARGVAALTAPGRIPVPEVVGMSRAAAAEALEELGLRTEVDRRVRSWRVAAGEVVRQLPASGKVAEGSVVRLVVSSGAPEIPLPSLVGLPRAIAEQRIRARGSSTAAIKSRHDEAPEGTVIAQSPAPGEIRFGTAVTLVVSRGPRMILVPQVAGMSKKEALAAVRAAGFEPTVVLSYSDDHEVGAVIGTNPGGGNTAPERSEVQVLVSQGPRYKEVRMPDVRGMTVDAATARLEELRLRVQVRQSCGGGGSIVADTDPISGTTIRENDLVVLFVC